VLGGHEPGGGRGLVPFQSTSWGVMQMLGGFFILEEKPQSRYLKTIKEPSLMGL